MRHGLSMQIRLSRQQDYIQTKLGQYIQIGSVEGDDHITKLAISLRNEVGRANFKKEDFHIGASVFKLFNDKWISFNIIKHLQIKGWKYIRKKLNGFSSDTVPSSLIGGFETNMDPEYISKKNFEGPIHLFLKNINIEYQRYQEWKTSV